jgi:hypothetical protein
MAQRQRIEQANRECLLRLTVGAVIRTLFRAAG